MSKAAYHRSQNHPRSVLSAPNRHGRPATLSSGPVVRRSNCAAEPTGRKVRHLIRSTSPVFPFRRLFDPISCRHRRFRSPQDPGWQIPSNAPSRALAARPTTLKSSWPRGRNFFADGAAPAVILAAPPDSEAEWGPRGASSLRYLVTSLRSEHARATLYDEHGSGGFSRWEAIRPSTRRLLFDAIYEPPWPTLLRHPRTVPRARCRRLSTRLHRRGHRHPARGRGIIQPGPLTDWP